MDQQQNSDHNDYLVNVLHETQASRDYGIADIRQWMRENEQLNAKPDAGLIVAFLRGCKFDLNKTKAKLKAYFELRRDAPEWFSNRNPLRPEIEELTRLGVFVPLRVNNEVDRHMVVIVRTAAHDPKRHQQNDVLKTGNMILDIAARDNENAQIYGVTAIFDMANITLGHARQLTPTIIRKIVTAIQNYHCRPQRLLFVNAPTYVNVVLDIFRSFMSSKLRKRVYVLYQTDTTKELPKFVSHCILPPEYGGGGENMTSLAEYWSNRLIENRHWFEEDEQYRAN